MNAASPSPPDLTASNSHPDFLAPPVVEVALSVAYQPITGFGLTHLVEAWRQKFRAEYPNVEEQAPFEMPIENLGDETGGRTIQLELVSPPLQPRLWLKDDAGTQLLQLQRNFFARNWRKLNTESDYPRYPSLASSFAENYGALVDYLRSADLPDPQPTQVEVAYINHIETSEEPPVRGIGSILTVVDESAAAFTDRPERMRFAAQYVMTHDGQAIGRLHLTAEPAIRRHDSQQIVVLTLTARGAPMGQDLLGIRSFLDQGRDWALKAFVGLTRPEMHAIWRRKTGGT